jgi:hypothetical protein
MTPQQSEAAFQQQCYMWFHNTYAELRGLLFHVNNNGSNSKREGAYYKALGVIAGVSDLLFLYNGKVFCIELKTPRGYQSPKQMDWQELVEANNTPYFIVRDIDTFKQIIEHIIEQNE